jgi:hypothetical protein
VLDGGVPDAGDVLPDGRRGRPQRRAEAAVPRPGRRRELRDRAARVTDGGAARLPPLRRDSRGVYQALLAESAAEMLERPARPWQPRGAGAGASHSPGAGTRPPTPSPGL